MANIGATTAFYKVETSLTRANNEVSKSMERLATGKANANAGDRSSFVAMSDTFRLDYVGTKAGIKGASVVMGYLETGMRVLDSASSLLSRLQELAVLGANATNTTADHEAINSEAEAIADEFNRLMSTAKYKGKPIFVDTAGSEYVSLGGRDSEMTFGIGSITYTDLYKTDANAITQASEPNNGVAFNLAHLPSDAVVPKAYGSATEQINDNSSRTTLAASSTYVVKGTLGTEYDMNDSNHDGPAAIAALISSDTSPASAGEVTVTDASASAAAGTLGSTTLAATDALAVGDIIETGSGVAPDMDSTQDGTVTGASTYAKVRTDADA